MPPTSRDLDLAGRDPPHKREHLLAVPFCERRPNPLILPSSSSDRGRRLAIDSSVLL